MHSRVATHRRPGPGGQGRRFGHHQLRHRWRTRAGFSPRVIGWSAPASGPKRSAFPPIECGRRRFLQRFRVRCMPRSSVRTRRSHIPRKSAGFTRRTGAVAVDNESHVAARIAAAHRIPFAACRAVIDPAHSVLPPAAVTGLRHDGTPDVLAVFRSVVRQPSQLPALARTALEARTAGAALRRGRRLLGVGLAFPYFREVTLDVPVAVEAI